MFVINIRRASAYLCRVNRKSEAGVKAGGSAGSPAGRGVSLMWLLLPLLAVGFQLFVVGILLFFAVAGSVIIIINEYTK